MRPETERAIWDAVRNAPGAFADAFVAKVTETCRLRRDLRTAKLCLVLACAGLVATIDGSSPLAWVLRSWFVGLAILEVVDLVKLRDR